MSDCLVTSQLQTQPPPISSHNIDICLSCQVLVQWCKKWMMDVGCYIRRKVGWDVLSKAAGTEKATETSGILKWNIPQTEKGLELKKTRHSLQTPKSIPRYTLTACLKRLRIFSLYYCIVGPRCNNIIINTNLAQIAEYDIRRALYLYFPLFFYTHTKIYLQRAFARIG